MIICQKLICLQVRLRFLCWLVLILWIRCSGSLMIVRLLICMSITLCLDPIHPLNSTRSICRYFCLVLWNGQEKVKFMIVLEVYVGVSTSNKFSHLYIRNGKMIAVLSLSIKFIVNNTGQGEPIPECI